MGGAVSDKGALFKEIVVINEMVVADVAQLSLAGFDKFKDDPVGLVYAEAPDFVVLGFGARHSY